MGHYRAAHAATRQAGDRREWTFREILDAIFYVLRGGIPWRMLPPCLPPWQTVYGWFAAWRDDGLFETINHALVMLIACASDGRRARARRSSTASRSRPRRPAARAAMMPARR